MLADSLMFDPSVVTKTSDFNARMVRLIYSYYGITNDQFQDLHLEWTMRSEEGRRKTANQISNDLSNKRRAISGDVLTTKVATKAIEILGSHINDIALVIKDPKTKKPKAFCYRDGVNKKGEYVPCNPKATEALENNNK